MTGRRIKKPIKTTSYTAKRPPSGKEAKEAKIILFNKPFHVLTQFTDAGGRKTIAEYVRIPGVYPAGRLDYDSEGLVILTDSGALQHSISSPENKMEKTYLAQVEGVPKTEALEKLQKGVVLDGVMTKKAKAGITQEPHWLWEREPPIRFRKNVPTSWIEITITEGRNRQVRRMCASTGHPVLRLIRTKIGLWALGSLKPGEYREERHLLTGAAASERT